MTSSVPSAARPPRGLPGFVVSSDKDMLQLVNDKVCVLNPPKDNLICDAAKVEEDSRRASGAGD